MTILIAKQNEPIIKQYLTGVKFLKAQKNTSTFKVSESTFQKLYNWVKSEGYNPFALMAW